MPTLTDNPARSAFVRGLSILLLAAITMAACAETPPAKEDPKERLAKAEAMFQERCKKAGEFIHRTAENVEGVLLMKVRPVGINHGDQFKLDDPYGRDFEGDAYIRSFLRGFYELNYRRPETPRLDTPPHLAYRFVEAVDSTDGLRYRYTGRIEEPWRNDSSFSRTYKRFVLDKALASGPTPRYGVTYEDISTAEDRAYWIAGSSLKVIDLHTNEVMAERVGYMMDRGQGNRSAGRSPWLLAADNACPAFARTHAATAQLLQSENFVEKVLKPQARY